MKLTWAGSMLFSSSCSSSMFCSCSCSLSDSSEAKRIGRLEQVLLLENTDPYPSDQSIGSIIPSDLSAGSVHRIHPSNPTIRWIQPSDPSTRPQLQNIPEFTARSVTFNVVSPFCYNIFLMVYLSITVVIWSGFTMYRTHGGKSSIEAFLHGSNT